MSRKQKVHKLNPIQFNNDNSEETKDWRELRDEAVDKRNEEHILSSIFRPKTKNQRIYVKSIDESEITFAIGPSGCGKTALACSKAVEYLIAGKVKQIVISRPLVEAGEVLGILPGDVNEKTQEYVAPILGYLSQFLTKRRVEKLVKDEIIKVVPIATMRGYTFHDSFVIIEEAQNIKYSQFKLILTRIGMNSKYVICGDIEQTDLDFKGQKIALLNVVEKLEKVDPRIHVVDLDDEDILRNPLISKILDALG